jgi:hypothetical protein
MELSQVRYAIRKGDAVCTVWKRNTFSSYCHRNEPHEISGMLYALHDNHPIYATLVYRDRTTAMSAYDASDWAERMAWEFCRLPRKACAWGFSAVTGVTCNAAELFSRKRCDLGNVTGAEHTAYGLGCGGVH